VTYALVIEGMDEDGRREFDSALAPLVTTERGRTERARQNAAALGPLMAAFVTANESAADG
jgi:hypothetical protein